MRSQSINHTTLPETVVCVVCLEYRPYNVSVHTAFFIVLERAINLKSRHMNQSVHDAVSDRADFSCVRRELSYRLRERVSPVTAQSDSESGEKL